MRAGGGRLCGALQPVSEIGEEPYLGISQMTVGVKPGPTLTGGGKLPPSCTIPHRSSPFRRKARTPIFGMLATSRLLLHQGKRNGIQPAHPPHSCKGDARQQLFQADQVQVAAEVRTTAQQALHAEEAVDLKRKRSLATCPHVSEKMPYSGLRSWRQ